MSSLKLTLVSWPLIALLTIGLCFLTQTVAKFFGIELPDQENIAIVKSYAGFNRVFVSLCFQILILMPAVEECLFRWVSRLAWKKTSVWATVAVILSALFSFAHYPDYLTLFKAQQFVLKPIDAAFLALFFFGFAQCWLYRKTSHLWCAMLNHALFNLTNLVLLFVIPSAQT